MRSAWQKRKKAALGCRPFRISLYLLLRRLAARQRVLQNLLQQLQLRRPREERNQVREGVIVTRELERIRQDPRRAALLLELRRAVRHLDEADRRVSLD